MIEPATAERVRTVCARGSAILAVDGAPPADCGVRHLRYDGDFALTVPAGCGVDESATEAPAVLELTDQAAVPVREPVRALVWIRGRIRHPEHTQVRPILDAIAAERPDPRLLDVGTGHRLLLLRIDSVVIADSTGAEPVAIDGLLRARPDPFWAVEQTWVRHLQRDHPELIARLARALPGWLRRDRVTLLGLDRYGVQLRVEGTDTQHDVRLPFAAPVADVAGLGRALRLLAGCPFTNGLRARPA